MRMTPKRIVVREWTGMNIWDMGKSGDRRSKLF